MNELPFQDQQLGPCQIRLLHLAPGHVGNELVGELRVQSLDDNLTCDILSYMWDDLTPVDSMIIHSKPNSGTSTQRQMLPVAHNLNNALQSLNYPDKDKTLIIWVDTVCINQMDLDERARQVTIMPQLYSRAQIVRSFINLEGSVDTECDAFKALQNFTLTPDLEQSFDLGTDLMFFDPVAPMFANPYWSRVWVQQEVLSAKELAIHCGGASLSCANLATFRIATRESLLVLRTGNPVKAGI